MGRGQAQISFISDVQTDAWIARETGIPRATIGFVRRGERDLPAQYVHSLRAVYQRESYGRMREIGFSAGQANRFRSYAPDTVKGMMAEVSNKIEWLARGTAALAQDDDKASGIFRSIDEYLQEARDAITEGFRRSQKPKEEWDKYGAEETDEE